jgi:hypothetical protein
MDLRECHQIFRIKAARIEAANGTSYAATINANVR